VKGAAGDCDCTATPVAEGKAFPMNSLPDGITVRPATPADVPLILAFIRELAEYEKLAHEVTATEALLHATMFGPQARAETLIGCVNGEAAGFAVFFYNYSTFLALPGIYLEDLYVRPPFRKLGLGKALLTTVARIAVERGCGRYEWSVLDWNEPSIRFYEGLGAEMHGAWRRMRVSGDALQKMAGMPASAVRD
jgi:GNAT superfamily N-acetyltransferase